MTEDKPNWPTEAEVRAAFPSPPDFGSTIRMMPVADHEAEIARLTAERDAALAGSVKVKPLVWKQLGDRAWRAPSPFFGSFRVECYGGPWQALWSVPGFCDTFVDGDFTTPDDAKRAIDARIRAAIQPDPDARQADLAKAFCKGLDAAADVADEIAMGLRENEYDDCADGAEDAAQAIRALTPPADMAAKIGGE